MKANIYWTYNTYGAVDPGAFLGHAVPVYQPVHAPLIKNYISSYGNSFGHYVSFSFEVSDHSRVVYLKMT